MQEKKPKRTSNKKPARKPTSSPGTGCYVVIDYPPANAILTHTHYAIRIGASDMYQAEISVNGTAWQPCRPAAGYWWYDWTEIQPGTHKLRARVKDATGKVQRKIATRTCTAQ